jgi:glycosyltransferase involved in cell wall biosynthesis
VQGKPHPAGWKVKEYYNELLELVETLGLQANVAFNDTFMPNPELYALLQSTHVYVNAYVDMTQSVSGTLAMALGAGTACVSTAYPYAAELLSEGAGLLVPVRDSQALADAIIHLLDDPRRIAELNVRAYELSRSMSWTAVAQQYVDLATR